MNPSMLYRKIVHHLHAIRVNFQTTINIDGKTAHLIHIFITIWGKQHMDETNKIDDVQLSRIPPAFHQRMFGQHISLSCLHLQAVYSYILS